MPSPLRNIVRQVSDGSLIVPRVTIALNASTWPEVNVKIPAPKSRKPDGWFHPSTHPLMNELQLYCYLAFPDKWQKEAMGELGWQAVSSGHFWHSWLSQVMLSNDIITAMDIPVQDDEAGTRGEMDVIWYTEEAGELKTMNDMSLRGIPKVRADDPEMVKWMLAKKPVYYAQAQEYLRMSGRDAMRFLFLGTSYPYPKRELVIPADSSYANMIREKYLWVRQAVADQRPPIIGCLKGLGDCPARSVCGCVR